MQGGVRKRTNEYIITEPFHRQGWILLDISFIVIEGTVLPCLKTIGVFDHLLVQFVQNRMVYKILEDNKAIARKGSDGDLKILLAEAASGDFFSRSYDRNRRRRKSRRHVKRCPRDVGSMRSCASVRKRGRKRVRRGTEAVRDVSQSCEEEMSRYWSLSWMDIRKAQEQLILYMSSTLRQPFITEGWSLKAEQVQVDRAKLNQIEQRNRQWQLDEADPQGFRPRSAGSSPDSPPRLQAS